MNTPGVQVPHPTRLMSKSWINEILIFMGMMNENVTKIRIPLLNDRLNSSS